MSLLEAIILGLVQGLTEFIPVSSSGHLVLLHELFGSYEEALAFDVFLHMGTLVALLIYFYKDILNLASGILHKNQYTKLAWLIVLATIPTFIGGFFLADTAETTFRSAYLVSFNLISVALLMILAEKMAARRKYFTKLDETTKGQALSVGVAQVVALIPGVSRSGSTITAGLFVGMDRVTATRFSFLMAVPVIAGAIAKVALDGSLGQQLNTEIAATAVGVVTALVSGLFAIKFLIKFVIKHSLHAFAYYRIALGVLVLLIA
jgi:undecaprenyl-diphosphatase